MAPGPGYTHVVTGSGRLVVLSGQVALDERGDVVGRGDAERQARQVFENLRRCLTSAGATFDDVVKLNFCVTDLHDLPVYRRVREEFINTQRPPASTAVQIVALALPGLMIEVEGWALVS